MSSRAFQIPKKHKDMRLKHWFTEELLYRALYIMISVTSPAYSKVDISNGTEAHRLTMNDLPHLPKGRTMTR